MGDLYVTIKYNDIRRIASFCGPIAKTGWNLSTSGVLLSTTPEGLKAQTGSNDIFAFGTLPAEVHAHGQCVVLGAAFDQIIKALSLKPDDLVDLAVVEDELDVRSTDGRYHRVLKLIPPDEFPVPAYPDLDESFIVPPDTAEWLKRTASAASTDSMRSPLDSIHIWKGGMMATDTYKFIIVEFPWDELEKEVNIPVGLIDQIPDPSSYGDGQIRIAVNDNMIALSFGQMTLCSTLVMGKYPDPNSIKGIIPSSDIYRFEIGVKDLRDSIKAIGPMIGPLGGATLHPDKRIRVISPDLGMAEDKLNFINEYTLPIPVTLPVSFMREVTSLLKESDSLEFLFHPEKPDKFPVVLFAEGKRVIIGAMPLQGPF